MQNGIGDKEIEMINYDTVRAMIDREVEGLYREINKLKEEIKKLKEEAIIKLEKRGD